MDLRDNGIGRDGAEYLAGKLRANYDLSVLLLDWNKIGAKGGKALAEMLAGNDGITVLGLAFTGIGQCRDVGLSALEEEAKEAEDEANAAKQKEEARSGAMAELQMTAEQREERRKKLAEEKKKEAHEKFLRSLLPPRKRLDLDMSFAEAWAKAFKANRRLVHLDISFNAFDSKEIEVISTGLKENHTLLGIHVDGNDCTVNSLGFLEAFDHDGK